MHEGVRSNLEDLAERIEGVAEAVGALSLLMGEIQLAGSAEPSVHADPVSPVPRPPRLLGSGDIANRLAAR